MPEAASTTQVDMTEGNTKRPQITVIIPTRNEAENIQPLLDRLSEALGTLSFEVLFVDDSTDDTAEVIRDLTRSYPFVIRLIVRPTSRRNGLSGAVVEGIVAAEGYWVCVMDADLQHPPLTIVRMWDQAQRTGADLVVGSREGDLFGPRGLSRLRSLNSQLLTILARMLFPRRLKNASDPLTGLFLVRRSAVDPAGLRPDGFKILLEILVRNPELQVSEVHFQFAPRYKGESKADVSEGARFLRHLLTLRSTANSHLGRFVAIALAALLGNSALLWAILSLIPGRPYFGVLLAAEVAWLGVFLAQEFWVFPERGSEGRRRRFWGYFLLSQLGIFLVHLPLVWVLAGLAGLDMAVANFLAFVVVGLLRYLLSEQWVWTRGAIAWQTPTYYYNLHDLVTIESQIPLRELATFIVDEEPAAVDVQIRVDRQGTPSLLHGGISYDDQLGRFGFGLSVLPGDYTQIIVSPLLEHSPDFLYTNVIEPVLRWGLVRKGYAMVKAACVARERSAVLINAERDLGNLVSYLCTRLDYAFLSDDLTILDSEGTVYSYPKPVTIDPAMLSEREKAPGLSEQLAFAGQRILYTRYARRFGLWLSNQDLPAATANTYLQRFIPQPKHDLAALFPKTALVNRGILAEVVCLGMDSPAENDTMDEVVAGLQQSETIAAFQPHPLLAHRLRNWGGEDLPAKEALIIRQALKKARIRYVNADSHDLWAYVVPQGGDSWIMGGSLPTNEDDAVKQRLQTAHGEPGPS